MLANVQLFIDSLQHILGFVIVLLVLAVLWGVTVLIGKIAVLVDSRNKETTPADTSRATTDTGSLSEEEVVAISAVVSLMMGRRARIVSLRSSTKDWSREGLREQFASHRIR